MYALVKKYVLVFMSVYTVYAHVSLHSYRNRMAKHLELSKFSCYGVVDVIRIFFLF